MHDGVGIALAAAHICSHFHHCFIDTISPDDACGYLNAQVEVFKHPGTGEYKVIVKGKDTSRQLRVHPSVCSQLACQYMQIVSQRMI